MQRLSADQKAIRFTGHESAITFWDIGEHELCGSPHEETQFYYSGADLDFPRPDGTTLLMEAAASYDADRLARLMNFQLALRAGVRRFSVRRVSACRSVRLL